MALFFLGKYDSGVVKDVNSVKLARKSIFKNHMIIFVDFVGAHLRVRPYIVLITLFVKLIFVVKSGIALAFSKCL